MFVFCVFKYYEDFVTNTDFKVLVAVFDTYDKASTFTNTNSGADYSIEQWRVE